MEEWEKSSAYLRDLLERIDAEDGSREGECQETTDNWAYKEDIRRRVIWLTRNLKNEIDSALGELKSKRSPTGGYNGEQNTNHGLKIT